MKTAQHQIPPTEAGPFAGSAMSEQAQLIAGARLRQAEMWVDLAFQGASKIGSIALLVAHGFNLMRSKVRVSESGAAATRFVG